MSQGTEASYTTEGTALNPLEAFDNYPFSSDETYQQGLASILAGGILEGKTEFEKAEIMRRSEVFYFNRITGNSITVEDTLRFNSSAANPALENTVVPPPADDGNRVLTFAELKELIEQGKTDQIPNNRHIPDNINDAPPSESTAPSRKKPWETE